MTTQQPVKVSSRKLLIPVFIGLGVSIYLIVSNFNPAALKSVHITNKLILGLCLSLLVVVIRDFAFMYKLRLSTGERMTWLKTLQTIIMWEFGAAITPKVGEVAFTLLVLKKAGLSYGRSVAAILLNTFLDNVVFVVMFVLLYSILGHRMLAVPANCTDLSGHPVMQAVSSLASKAWIGFAILFLLASFFGIALFILPKSTKRFFYRISEFKLLAPLENTLIHLGDEIEITAHEYKNQNLWFYARMLTATWINWTARYLLANTLLFAFSNGPLDMLQVFARQYVLWIFMIIPSTPGSSGIAEISFIALNCQFMPAGLSAAIALIWRIYSYYLYLVAGMLVLPKWTSNAVSQS